MNIIETPRLVLREMTLDDVDFVASMLAHPEVMGFFPRCYSRPEAEAWVLRQLDRYAGDGYGYWLAIAKAADEPVGQTGLMQIQVDGVDETGLGYIIHRPHWGRGYATESAAACVDHAFGALDRPRVVAPVRPGNAASVRVALKLGMTPEKLAMFAGFEHVVYARERPQG